MPLKFGNLMYARWNIDYARAQRCVLQFEAPILEADRGINSSYFFLGDANIGFSNLNGMMIEDFVEQN